MTTLRHAHANEELLIERRREAVAQLLIKGLSVRKIVLTLTAASDQWTADGASPTAALVEEDIAAIRAGYAAALESLTVDDHLAEVLSELREVKRLAWARTVMQDGEKVSAPDFDSIRKTGAQIADLLERRDALKRQAQSGGKYRRANASE